MNKINQLATGDDENKGDDDVKDYHNGFLKLYNAKEELIMDVKLIRNDDQHPPRRFLTKDYVKNDKFKGKIKTVELEGNVVNLDNVEWDFTEKKEEPKG